ncbi:ribosomal protein L11 methyltransferase [Maritalea mobilis]|uniref:Ribosomal protein L11 methyltransferase n=1 Tax=Maritalea mobilis TaxID=483324 RepID=A0A4R6VVY9_9HYPH|nr:50S ribosomal protein L11 methyltransferase [Maritalea mobilis]TDQ66780.1 ribosomal protein L11 methyltransferase [Maritalea mobilis]
MSLNQISVPLTKEEAYKLVDAVSELEDMALSAVAYEGPDGEHWVFEATCDEKPDIEKFNALAKQVLGDDVEFEVAPVPEKDWVAHSLEGLKPVEAGGFFVHGSHDDAPSDQNVIPIKIDAGQAFGTGHHETTSGCLAALDLYLQENKPAAILDLGTGTGILAIAAAKRTELNILATDIDPKAVEVTIENAEINGVLDQIIAETADGFDHPIFAEHGPFDLIMANILAGPLIELAPQLVEQAKPGATIILAGLLTRQAEDVIAAYTAQKTTLLAQSEKGDWSILTLKAS